MRVEKYLRPDLLVLEVSPGKFICDSNDPTIEDLGEFTDTDNWGDGLA